MLASTAARVLSWYFRTRAVLDSPVQFTIQTEATAYGDDPWQITSRWDVAPSARRRETLLAEVSTIGLALMRIPDRDRAILVERYDPDRGITDRQLAEALGCDREEAREAVAVALVALGGQLVRQGLIHMNGRPTWAGQ
jgi:DNA-directed RNA polymerase specialized sigma24 family protein